MGIKNDKVLNKTGTEYLVSKIKTLITQSINGLATVARTGSYNDLSDKPQHLGHSIEDSTTTFTDRANLKFTGSVAVTDDSQNDTTEIEILGTQDHVYSTKTAMLADLANVGEGETMYTLENSGDLVTRVENLETNKQDKKLTAKTGAVGTVNTTIAANTTVDNGIKQLLDNDATINSNLTEQWVDITYTTNMPSGSVFARKYSNCVEIKVFHQHPVQSLGTSSDYAAIGELPVGMRPKSESVNWFKYILINDTKLCQLNVYSNGVVYIGYSKSITSGTAMNIESYDHLYIDETFII